MIRAVDQAIADEVVNERELVQHVAAQTVGRESELAALEAFLGHEASVRALVLTGGLGIGKTTLWECGIAAARARGLRILAARPEDAETRLSFAGLVDLLDGVSAEALTGIPPPQRHALEVSLLRADPAGEPPETRAIVVGFLGALRLLAAAEPLLIAVDDVQWLDSESAHALAFAARRLSDSRVRFLLATRAERPGELERSLASDVTRLDVGPLSAAATRHMLFEQFRLPLPRRVLLRIFEFAQGNPLFALELGRELAAHGSPGIGEELVVPARIEDLLAARVDRLPASARRVVLALGLGGELGLAQLAAIGGVGGLDAALDAGVLLVKRDRVRLAHPLLGAAARHRARAGERRAVHLELTRTIEGEQRRVRHLALAAAEPDAALAATIAAAAARASARHDVEDAVELGGQALRLTAPEAPERADRLIALAEYLDVAGEDQRVTALLAPEIESLPRGALRARAHLLLADGGVPAHTDEIEHHLEWAVTESAGDARLQASALAMMATHLAVTRVQRIRDSEALALEAVRIAGDADADARSVVLFSLAWARSLRGGAIEDLRARPHAVSDARRLHRSLDRVTGVRLMWRGETGAARAILRPLSVLADERDEPASYFVARVHLCELALRAGEWEAAARVLEEWEQSSDGTNGVGPIPARCRALLAAGRGDPAEAERWATAAIADARTSGMRWDELEALRARGIGALLAHEPARAVASLRCVWEITRSEGVEDPGAFPVAPELVEALLANGEPAEALAVTEHLRELAERHDHPWGRVTAKRCGAAVRIASGYEAQAVAALLQAAADYELLGLRFDRARTLLGLGQALSRLKKWGAARDSLEQAATAFEQLASAGWAEQARSKLARVGARRPRPPGELTPSEQRVAALAADGLSNQQIAHALYVTVRTVEAHLTHAYAKLGVRSRSQLAGSALLAR